MTRAAILCAALLVAAPAAEGHALDEYVQALRVDIQAARLVVSLDLTPGITIAPEVLRLIDRDRDDVISPAEAEAYGRTVMADLTLSLDGNAAPLSLMRVEVPPAEELRGGQSAIRLALSAPGVDTAARHRLVVRNGHAPAMSVYLANALLPDAPDVRIERQQRDERQQTLTVDYDLRRVHTAGVAWLAIACATLTALVRLRRSGLRDHGSGLGDQEDASDLKYF